MFFSTVFKLVILIRSMKVVFVIYESGAKCLINIFFYIICIGYYLKENQYLYDDQFVFL